MVLYTCEINPPIPASNSSSIFTTCCVNSYNTTPSDLTNFACDSRKSSSNLTKCITDATKSNSVCTSSSNPKMDSAPSPARSGWKFSVLSVALAFALAISSASAAPVVANQLRLKNGGVAPITQIGDGTFKVAAACADIQALDCFDAVYDVCSDNQCSSNCNCIIQGHNIGDATNAGAPDGKCLQWESGQYGCAPFLNGGTEGEIYVKMDSYAVANADIVITRDQTCPPSGPNAVLASIHHGGGCVYVGQQSPGWGVSAYPVGGSPYRYMAPSNSSSAAVASRSLQKRGDCTMDVEEQVETYSTTVIISETVDCTGKSDPCSIDIGKQHTESVESTWSLDTGFSAFGVSIGTSFGGSYTQSDTSVMQDSITVEAGQEGYLTYYVEATRFTGTFRGCDQEGQRGSVYAIKNADENPSVVHYAVVNTNK